MESIEGSRGLRCGEPISKIGEGEDERMMVPESWSEVGESKVEE